MSAARTSTLRCAHWHRAARSECRSEESAELDRYESALRRAVGTRRDLGLLATNPLMCALLCALNRDRRMQLPRARKELYDAALDMLLVRRDTEREVIGVEGVDLTREEQTALLQRLAYWLIRNGLAEARQDEVVALVADWLRAMSQVRGDPDQVFTHLLNRSGLLREPAPGAVGFVHRTFQDYLGAKAAVEARDFGVLVRHAHEDQWDDVVQMAVGHARPDERASLLTALLKRADGESEWEHRLVLLAAGGLAHAPELDPEVRTTVEGRTERLLPPDGEASIDRLARIGDLALELLSPMVDGLTDRQAAAVVQTAAAVRTDMAYELVKQFRGDTRSMVAHRISVSWEHFDADRYAREVMAAQTWADSYAHLRTSAQLSALRHIPQLKAVQVTGDHADLSALWNRPETERVFLYRNEKLADLGPLARMPRVRDIGVSHCPHVQDIAPLARPGLEWLSLVELHGALDLAPLSDMPDLEHLTLGHYVGDLPVCAKVASLDLLPQTGHLSLEGLGSRCPRLERLALYRPGHVEQLSDEESLFGLTNLLLSHVWELDLRLLARLGRLSDLFLNNCDLSGSGLAPLADLPSLTTLCLHNSGEPVDLTPLADAEHLTIEVGYGSHVTGTEHFPPERIIHLP
ncbi:ATP-binding protein [Streptomyces badius]